MMIQNIQANSSQKSRLGTHQPHAPPDLPEQNNTGTHPPTSQQPPTPRQSAAGSQPNAPTKVSSQVPRVTSPWPRPSSDPRSSLSVISGSSGRHLSPPTAPTMLPEPMLTWHAGAAPLARGCISTSESESASTTVGAESAPSGRQARMIPRLGGMSEGSELLEPALRWYPRGGKHELRGMLSSCGHQSHRKVRN